MDAASELKKPIEYERAEIEADITAFAEKEQPVIMKYIRGESLAPDEAETMRTARARWFEEKYGVPYHNKAMRQEVLLRKYAPSEELARAHDLEKKMFEALGGNASPETIDELKKEYLARYPDQLEGIEILFGIRPFLELSKKFNDNPYAPREYSKKELLKIYQDFTETNFLLTHFVETNNGDKQFLSLFWTALENIARAAGLSKNMNMTRKGIVTQVATMRIFEALGLHPKLSHPRDDAFSKIDLWSDDLHAVQIKGTSEDKLEIIEADTLCFPGAEFEQDGKTKQVSSSSLGEAQKFGIKLDEYRKFTGQHDLKGFFIVIPRAKIDFSTGEPDKDLVTAVKEKLNRGGLSET